MATLKKQLKFKRKAREGKPKPVKKEKMETKNQQKEVIGVISNDQMSSGEQSSPVGAPTQVVQPVAVPPSVSQSFPTPVVVQSNPSQPEQPESPQVSPPASSSPLQSSSLSDIEPPSGKGKMWIIISILLIVIALVAGGLYYFREGVMKRFENKKITEKLSPTPSPVLSPTPAKATESAALVVDLSKYKIMVLNGSGIAGEASKARDLLEEKEFVVEDIGNADSSDYEKTVIKAKKEVSKEFLEKLETVLKESFLLGPNETLNATDSSDVILVIGSEKP